MSLVPREVSREHARHELAGAVAWAARQGWSLSFDEESLALIGTVVHPNDGRPLYLVGDLTDYRVHPPGWRFTDESGASNSPGTWPKGGLIGPGKGSIFHGERIICAPFNRLAYVKLHTNWGGGQPTGSMSLPNTSER